MRIGSAVAAGLGHQPDGAGLFDPSLGGQNKAVQTGLFSKPIEFDGFKIGVVELLPDAEKLYGVAVAQPVLNNVVGPLRIAVPGNVGQRNVVVLFLVIDGNRTTLDADGPVFNLLASRRVITNILICNPQLMFCRWLRHDPVCTRRPRLHTLITARYRLSSHRVQFAKSLRSADWLLQCILLSSRPPDGAFRENPGH